MKGSIKLFKIFGISINIHLTFLLLPLIFGYLWGAKGVVLILLVFCFVTAHELCHSLVARKFGITVDNITLLPIGGVAAMKSSPEKPKHEFAIAIAGPLFNIVLAAVLFFPAYYLLGPENLFNPGIGNWYRVLAYAFWINPILAAFNLLPAFPMDGGRILRAFLADRMDYRKATEIAAGLGHTFAVIFGLIGIFYSRLMLVVIAVFIYMAASQEEAQVDVKMILNKFYVKDILRSDYFSVTPDMPLSEVLELVFQNHQEDFPVLENDKLVGLLTRADLVGGIHKLGMNTLTGDIMRREFPTATLREKLTSVYKKFEEWGVKAVPVVSNKEIAGIITLDDLSRIYTFVK